MMRITKLANGRRGGSVSPQALALLGIGLMGLLSWAGCVPERAGEGSRPAVPGAGSGAPPAPTSPLDATYAIEGKKVSLKGGRYEEPAAPGSASIAVIQVVGKVAYGELDGDGKEDAALVLAWSGGGSGTFYYAAAAIVRDGSYAGTNGVFLGDRIVPRTLEIRGSVISVGYLDRRPGQPMAAPPGEVRTKRLAFRGGALEEIRVP